MRRLFYRFECFVMLSVLSLAGFYAARHPGAALVAFGVYCIARKAIEPAWPVLGLDQAMGPYYANTNRGKQVSKPSYVTLQTSAFKARSRDTDDAQSTPPFSGARMK